MYAREWLLAIDEKDMSFGGERRALDSKVWPSDLRGNTSDLDRSAGVPPAVRAASRRPLHVASISRTRSASTSSRGGRDAHRTAGETLALRSDSLTI